MSTASGGKREGERARPSVPPDLTLAIALCAVALVVEAMAFLGSDPWIGGDLVGAGFLLLFVAHVIAEPGGPVGRELASGWGRAVVPLLVGITLLFVRPSPLPPAVVQGLAVAGAAYSVFEGLLKAGTRRS